MITKEHFLHIKQKYGDFASWAVWAEEGSKPKSNVGDLGIFDLDKNPGLLDILNPNIIMVGLNCSRTVEQKAFSNFHDKSPKAQDYKIRYAFRDTGFYGAYMTDIIKNYEETHSGKVLDYLKKQPEVLPENINLFEQEIEDLKCSDPFIIAFGKDAYKILNEALGFKYRIQSIKHYSFQVGKEQYKAEVLETLLNIESA